MIKPIKVLPSKQNKTQKTSKLPPFNAISNLTVSNACSQGTFHMSSTLQGGRDAGRFDYKGQTTDTDDCLKLCCDVKDCDLAYLDGGACYAVHCTNKQLCQPVPAITAVNAPSVFYVSRKNQSNTASGKS